MIYLASPYTHTDHEVRQQRFEQACDAAAAIINRGVVVYSPIAHSHPIAARNKLPTDWEFWERLDREFIARSDEMHVLMLAGWRESKGVTAEIAIANELGIPVVFVEP